MRNRLLPLLSSSVVLSVWLVADSAHAGSTCVVPEELDPVQAAVLLNDCVDAVNEGSVSTIDFAVSQSYSIDQPIVLERDVTINGAGQKLTPAAGFGGGDNLIVVGTGSGAITAEINGVELVSAGVVDVRAIQVEAAQVLLLDGVSILYFVHTGGDGAGVHGESGSRIVITSSHLAANRASRGGAVHSDGGEVVIDGSVLNSNDADNNGGALATTSSATVTLSDTRFLFNSAVEDGGAVHIGQGASAVTVTETLFSFNEADDDGGGFWGGGDFTNCDFERNYAHDRGGGAVLGPESHVVGTTFFENEAYRGGGLALLLDGTHNMSVEGSTFEGNHADRHTPSQNQPTGGGLYVSRTSGTTPGVVDVTNSTFSSNSSLGAAATYGGGFALAMVRATLAHVTFFDNDAAFGGAIHTSSSPSTVLALNSSIVAGSPSAACSINGPYTHDTSLDDDDSCGVTFNLIDPLLDPLQDNGGPTYTHIPMAPVVQNAATCHATIDQRGQARPATSCDIGSVEQ